MEPKVEIRYRDHMAEDEIILDILNKANYRKLMNQYQRCVDDLEKAIKTYPNEIGLYLNLGLLYIEIGCHDLGIKYLICVMHLLIRDSIEKNKGVKHYPRRDRRKDLNFIEHLDSETMKSLPVLEAFKVFQDEKVCLAVGEVLYNTIKDKDLLKKIGREYILSHLDWYSMNDDNVREIYLEKEK